MARTRLAAAQVEWMGIPGKVLRAVRVDFWWHSLAPPAISAGLG